MREKIDCFLPCKNLAEMESTIQQMRGARMIHHIFLMVSKEMAATEEAPANCSFVVIDRVQSEATIREIERKVTAEYVLLYLKDTPLLLGLYTTVRMIQCASGTDAAMVYGDRYEERRVCKEERGERREERGERKEESAEIIRVPHPVIDYQLGSVRDDFDFGSLLLMAISMPDSMPFAFI